MYFILCEGLKSYSSLFFNANNIKLRHLFRNILTKKGELRRIKKENKRLLKEHYEKK